MSIRFLKAVYLALVVVFSSSVYAGGYESTTLKYEHLMASIEKRGPKNLVKEIYSNDDLWFEFLEKISSGEEEWLNIAEKVLPAADAGARETLYFAIGNAIETEAERVLVFSKGSGIELRRICGGIDIDNSKYDSYYSSIKV